jgi:hypothetical protein
MGLEEVLNDGATRLELPQRFARVRASAERIWQQQRLAWFTDHTATRHSPRIADLLGALTERLQQTDQRLTPVEAYVLLAATYLHDVGMQDFRVDGRGMEQLTPADYNTIRKRHPERGHELIMERALQLEPGHDHFRIDLDADQYLLPIALVARGHGSAFYERTLREFESREFAPDNQVLRGALLTALLLIADELDLHEDRATFPPEMTLSPMSSLHHHVNHYVTRVTVEAGATPQQRSVRLSFAFPHKSHGYQADVRSFIVDKLVRQARRVNPALREGSAGELELDTVVQVREATETAPGPRRELPAAALALLRAVLSEQRLVGRETLVVELKGWIDARAAVQLEIGAGDGSDLPTLLRWLHAYASLRGTSWIHFDAGIGVATEPPDLWKRFRAQRPAGTSGDTGSLADFLAEDTYAVWVIESVDRLHDNSRTWLRDELQRFAADQRPALVITTHAPNATPPLGLAFTRRLEKLTGEAIIAHLERRFGYPAEEATTRGSEILVFSDGVPRRVLYGLEAQRRRQQRVIEVSAP